MAWFVIFGTKHRPVRRGLIVDVCVQCHGPRPFLVVDHFSTTHLYYIEVDSGRYTGSTCSCYECSVQMPFVPDRYSGILPVAAAESLTIDEGLEQTNRALSRLLTLLRRFRTAQAVPYRGVAAGSPESVAEILDSAERIVFRGSDVTPFVERISRIPELKAVELQELAAELRGYELALVR